MSSPPTAPDSPLGKLYADGYDLALSEGHLFVRQLPYVGPDGLLPDGQLVLPVNDSGGTIVDALTDHTIWFVGAEPRSARGAALGSASPREVGQGLTADWMLSFKPPSNTYPSLYEKVRQYARILLTAAQQVDPTVTATPGAAFQLVEDNLPLTYRDTNTTRAGLTALSSLFRGHVVAIVGVGGTGSYILDQVAKTWVDRIVLLDGDVFDNHNAFRAPGAAALTDMQAQRNKAEYFAEQYGRMHLGITAHPVALTQDNLHLLNGATFVFLAAADSDERPAVMAWLRAQGIPFIDVGMGFHLEGGGLTGLAKVNVHLPGGTKALPSIIEKPAADDYGSNIQVADLNCLNAMLAVIAWKKHLGFYAAHATSDEIVYKLFMNEIRNGGTP